MSRVSPASRILTRVARTVLQPIGLRQKGRSRLWVGDHLWWLVVVEFQPSSWSQGSYLNVAAMWLWHRVDHYHFDNPDSRVHSHVEFREEAEFEAAARSLAELAAQRVQVLRDRFSSLQAVAAHLRATPLVHGSWPEYDAGVAAALTGDIARAQAAFDNIIASRGADEPAWAQDLCRLAAELRKLCVEPTAFRAWASEVVAESRRLLKLPASTSTAFA